ncbi:MAG: hypothetical protein EOO42_01845 [Flavobacteriales bacterium]|nr:MAG: hypothetical protein EOO42_01845 [Flavobacteriales bacterium]
MRKLNKPTILSHIVYSACIGVVRNLGLRGRLNACLPNILAAEIELNSKITRGTVYTIPQEAIVNGNVTATELKDVYTLRMVGNTAGRVFYDQILISSPTGLCPYCSHGNVSTIDHYLPKALYPCLATVPINLIPSCGDCQDKNIDFPVNANTETLHPYYDDIENDLWLKADLVMNVPLTVRFSVLQAVGWSNLLFERTKSHLECYNLHVLYAVQAGREMSELKKLLQINFGKTGEAGIKQLLEETTLSKELSNLNSWKSALYRELSTNQWFYSGGFENIT